MDSQIVTSNSAFSVDNYTAKAWNLVAVLLYIGRPASPAEIAANLYIFTVSPEFVEFLCFIPDSPIFLSKDGVVLLSASVFRAVGEFFAVSTLNVRIGVFRGEGGNVSRNHFERWKNFRSEIEVTPMVRTRAILESIEEDESGKESFDCNDKIVLCLNALPFHMPEGVPLRIHSDMVLTRSIASSNNQLHKSHGEIERTYFRKRKKFRNEVPVPLVKKRAVVTPTQGNEQEEGFHSSYQLVLALPLILPRGVALQNLSDKAVIPSMAISNTGLLEDQSKNDVDQGSEINLKPSQDDYMCTDVVMERHLDKYYDNDGTTIDIPHAQGQIPETMIEDVVDMPSNDYGLPRGRVEKENLSLGFCRIGSFLEDILCYTTTDSVKQLTSPEDVANNVGSNHARLSPKPQIHNLKTFAEISASQKNVSKLTQKLKQKAPPKLLHDSQVDNFGKDMRGQKDQTTIASKHNSKYKASNSAAVQVNCANKSLKEQQKSVYPEFEYYTVEEEEGSGGYGTVYRAKRKTDGVTFAIKCPHAKSHVHHLKNELKMLQRFGGKNFIIKYEDSLKNGTSDCLVLEHVEHDRPEALKREIDINQLQWYGFCLFKALSSLHKQGVFHRDIKPGNFLFSCKTSKGYLIDFNLAKDLHQQPGSFDQSQPGNIGAAEHSSARQHKFDSPTKRRKILIGKSSEAYKGGTTSSTNHTLDRRTLKRKTVDKLKFYDDLGRRNSVISQAADGSGLTSKDMTSTKTSGERLREPIPCHGRKELISLAQQAMQSPSIRTGSAPLSKRKRVNASPVLMDQKFIYLTPTPLHSSSKCVSGAGLWKNKAVKLPKEGPCVGTKGYRAPEVLLRSTFQGPKIDVWSAGVSLLYLITGKMPFTGDPEQNMKDIVKLKGNEDLWEVAKLHNRESSLPEELLDIRFLQSMSIKEWCVANTKRTKFLDAIPGSLFDLIEKCLTVNPRLRIASEEALRHEFFAPCHDTMQRIKMRKQSQNQQSRGNSLPLLLEPVRTPDRQVVPPVNY